MKKGLSLLPVRPHISLQRLGLGVAHVDNVIDTGIDSQYHRILEKSRPSLMIFGRFQGQRLGQKAALLIKTT
jgi:hypothetical protein